MASIESTEKRIKPPHTVKVALEYANMRPTPRSWRRQILRPVNRPSATGISEETLREDRPLFGVGSMAELEAMLTEYRQLLEDIIKTRNYRSAAARELWQSLFRRANLVVVDWHVNPRDGGAVSEWTTRGETFAEVLYSYLQLALIDVRPSNIHKCTECAKYFFKVTAHRVQYCTERCKRRKMMREYRRRKRGKSKSSTRGTRKD